MLRMSNFQAHDSFMQHNTLFDWGVMCLVLLQSFFLSSDVEWTSSQIYFDFGFTSLISNRVDGPPLLESYGTYPVLFCNITINTNHHVNSRFSGLVLCFSFLSENFQNYKKNLNFSSLFGTLGLSVLCSMLLIHETSPPIVSQLAYRTPPKTISTLRVGFVRRVCVTPWFGPFGGGYAP